MTAHEALSHEWIAGPESGRGEEDLLPTVKKNFNARRTLHKAIDTVRAINQLRAGGLGMMDGAASTNPKRVDAALENAKPKDEDVNMEDVDPPGGPNDSAIVIDPRGHGRGQTDAQIAEQQRRIEETTQGIWKGRLGLGAS
jgi:hypothetical protein